MGKIDIITLIIVIIALMVAAHSFGRAQVIYNTAKQSRSK